MLICYGTASLLTWLLSVSIWLLSVSCSILLFDLDRSWDSLKAAKISSINLSLSLNSKYDKMISTPVLIRSIFDTV